MEAALLLTVQLIAVLSVGSAAAGATAAPAPAAAAAPSTPDWACSLVLSNDGTPTRICADGSCNASQQYLRGSVLVLSTGSISYTHGGTSPAGSSPAACCRLCKEQDLCTAWTFCNRKEGCGPKQSCSVYVKALPKSTVSLSNTNRQALPMRGFGPFGPSCTSDGRFPHQMCSLKSPTNLVPYGEGAAAEGFVSGFLPRTASTAPGCPPGLTAATCTACAATAAPEKCYMCARKVQLWGSGSGSCVACASLPSAVQQDTCISCLQDFPAELNSCSGCIQWQSNDVLNRTATAACFDCVANAGKEKRRLSGCVQCYRCHPPPSDLATCLRCASDKQLAPAGSYGCASCYQQPSKYISGCRSCLQQFSYPSTTTAASNCGGCAQAAIQAAAGASEQCYACVAKASAYAGYYCSNMEKLDPVVVAILPEYYKCLSLPDKLTGSGGSCGSCLYAPVAPNNSAKCLSCVAAMASSPSASTWCSSCWNGKTKQPQLCQDCLINSGEAGYTCPQKQ